MSALQRIFLDLGGRDEQVWHEGVTFLWISYILKSYCYQIMNALIYGRLTCFSFNDSDILCWAVPTFCFWGNEQYLSFASHTRLAMFFLRVKRNKEWLLWQMTERALHHPLPPSFPLRLSTGHQIGMARLIFLLSNRSICKWGKKFF